MITRTVDQPVDMFQEPPVIQTFNTLPPAWDRPGMFVANLFSLFFGNANQTKDLCTEVGKLETYGGRLVPILGLMFNGKGANTVVLEQEPDRRLFEYFSDRLGLSLPQIAVLNHRDYERLSGSSTEFGAATDLIRSLKEHPKCWLDGFVTDAALDVIAKASGHTTLNSREGSYEGNHKVKLHQHLEACGLPTFASHLATNRDQINHAREQLSYSGYDRAVIKTAIGASGVGLWQIPTRGDAKDVPDYCFHEGPCLVQGWLDDKIADVQAVYSPSVQLFVRPEAVHLYDLTDQILSADSIHEGNQSPPPWVEDDPATKDQLLRQAAIVGQWLHGRGYRGTASIDFHVADRTGGREVRVCEVNARVTGATYPALLARHFALGKAWLMRNLRFEPAVDPGEVLSRLEKAGLLFQTEDDQNVLPINFNAVAGGKLSKGQFLCIGPDAETTFSLLERTCAALSTKEGFDRD